MPEASIQLLLDQMDYTFGHGGWFRALDRAVEGLTAEQAAWHPGHGVNTIWQTVNHLTFWKTLCARRLDGAPLTAERIDNTTTFGNAGQPGDELAWRIALEHLASAHRAYHEAVSRYHEWDLESPLPGERTPLKELLLALNVHDAYHLGQIVTIRKLQDSWPRSS